MAKFSKADSRRMYNWWWDSHISPKNSKWLQENLTDMDSKVKLMIKLIEEDGDSFARRAEMYYKKRPELMKLVEEFYRAYRALAERYDHATGVIQHAHHTMAEAFPNQVQSLFPDDASSSVSGSDSRTSDPSTPVGGGESIDESDSVSVSRKLALKHFRDQFMSTDRTRRSLSFDEMEERDQRANSSGNSYAKHMNMLKSNPFRDSEEIQALKESIAKLEAEKEDGHAQYQQSLDKLSELEVEMAKTKDDFRVLSDHAKKAENEVIILNKKLTEVEAEKKSNLQGYQHCVAKISELQENAEKLNEQVESAEAQAQSLRSELEKLSVEKDAALSQYMDSLETISNVENKLRVAEEEARMLKERAEKAETELDVLRESVIKLNEEKEFLVQKHRLCLDTISALEEKLKSAEEESKRLNAEIGNDAAKLKCAEEQVSSLEISNQSLHGEIKTLLSSIQEERTRFAEAETGFQTLKHLHARTQDELRVMASELQHRAETLKGLETEKQSLLEEVVEVKKQNEQLEDVNASSELSINDMRNEISSLVESKGKLEQEMELRLDQSNELQQEIHCLKEELNRLNKNHVGILNQVHAVGLNADSLESSVKELKNEKSTLLRRLAILDQLLEKNSLLESSLSDLNAELEAARGKIEKLELLLQSLLNEKSSIFDEKVSLALQLEDANKNLEKLSLNNSVLENSLADALNQHEVLMEKSKILESSCQLLLNEKTGLKNEYDELSYQLEISQMKLESIGKLHGEVEERRVVLVKERASNICKVEELQLSLDVEKQKHASYIQKCETQFTRSETEMRNLQNECRKREGELDQVINRTITNDIEIFVLSVTARELKERNHSLSVENHKLSDESLLLGKKISELEGNNLKQNTEIKSLIDQNGNLRAGIRQLLKALDIVDDFYCDCKAEKDRVYVNLVLSKLQKMKESLKKYDEEKIESAVKLSILLTWIGQLTDMNEELRSELRKKECKKEALVTQIDDLMVKLKDIEGSYQELQGENSEIYLEKRSFMDKIQELEERNKIIEEENYVLCDEILNLENLSVIFRAVADERVAMMREIGIDINNLHNLNAALVGKLSLTEGRLVESETENHHLKEDMVSIKNQWDELKMSQEENENQIQKLSADTYNLRSENSFLHEAILNLEVELQKKILEMNELESGASTLLGKLQYFMVTEFLYEQKLNELHEACVGFIDENKDLKTELAAFAPEIELLRECILSLEDHPKSLHPENEELKDADVAKISNENNKNETLRSMLFDLHDVRAKLQAAVKEAIKIKEHMVQERADLHLKLNEKQNQKPNFEIAEADDVSLLTKDIELDQVSDGSSQRHRKRASMDYENEIVELWETPGPESTIALSKSKNRKNEKFRLPTSDSSIEKEFSLDMLEPSKKSSPDPNQEANKRKILERLDSDVQRLANLQITVQDLKRKLNFTAKGKGGKAVIEIETLKQQLEEADTAILKLFDLNGRLMKSIDDRSSSDVKSFSSFELEGEDGDAKRRKIAHQARRMSGKIGRLELEIQRLHFVLVKLMDDEKESRSKISARRRVLLRDYLYGVKGRTKAQFCLCMEPSATKD